VLKTSSLIDYLKECIGAREDISIAFVFGSIASGKEQATSDIDLFIIGSIGLRTLSTVLGDFRATIGRDVNPHVFKLEEFLKRIADAEHFVSTVLLSPKLFVKGSQHDLAEMG